MGVAITLKFITTVALYLQLLTLVYLYSGNRARFFRYLVWAWGLFVVSKGSYIIQHFFPAAEGVIPLLNAAGSAGDLLILAAGLAFRRDYRLRWHHVALGVAYAVLSSLLSTPPESGIEMPLLRRVVGGSALITAGVAFWPWRSTATSPRGCRFLSISFALWGLGRMATSFVVAPPDSVAFVICSTALTLFYFLSVLAIIILVLDRARGEVASLKEFNERLVDGLGEGLELVDGEFTIRHANRWMSEQFGPVVGRRCYEVLTADQSAVSRLSPGASGCHGCTYSPGNPRAGRPALPADLLAGAPGRWADLPPRARQRYHRTGATAPATERSRALGGCGGTRRRPGARDPQSIGSHPERCDTARGGGNTDS